MQREQNSRYASHNGLIQGYLKPVSEKPCPYRSAAVGKVLKIDRFGNVVTSFHLNDFPNLERQDFTLSVGLLRSLAEPGKRVETHSLRAGRGSGAGDRVAGGHTSGV